VDDSLITFSRGHRVPKMNFLFFLEVALVAYKDSLFWFLIFREGGTRVPSPEDWHGADLRR